MPRQVGGRCPGGLIAVFGASLVAFLFMRVLPGDPARLIVGPLATQQAIEEQKKAMGLDQPLWVQYWRYIKGAFTGAWRFGARSRETRAHAQGAPLPRSAGVGLHAAA